MNNTALKLLVAASVLSPVAALAQGGKPTTATVITKDEIAKISATEQSQRTRDENAKVVDIGDGYSMELGIVHRSSTRTPAPPRAAGAAPAEEREPCGRTMATLPPATAAAWARARRRLLRPPPGGAGRSSALCLDDASQTPMRRRLLSGAGLASGNELSCNVLIVPPGVVHGWADVPESSCGLSHPPSVAWRDEEWLGQSDDRGRVTWLGFSWRTE